MGDHSFIHYWKKNVAGAKPYFISGSSRIEEAYDIIMHTDEDASRRIASPEEYYMHSDVFRRLFHLTVLPS